MNKVISAKDLMKDYVRGSDGYSTNVVIDVEDAIEFAIEYARLHREAILKAAYLNSEMRVSENDTNEHPSFTDSYDDGYVTITVSKSSIMDSYPEENIK